ncbi:exosortase F system-associated membrane protein [Flavobacterium rhizosphaerae]|uniref:Exosortase F system-associated protein n=1 Tax=Flavobacterium rhizosphaerae TaxID=3163298 RepID=A0ABW8YWT6_9FLAO
MLKKLRLSVIDIIVIVIMLAGLVCIRIFQEQLFYDPLIAFFKLGRGKVLPPFDKMRLFYGLAFRYLLNTVFSLIIIWIIFKNYQVFKLSAILYIVLFVLLCVAFFIITSTPYPDLLLVFYVRRFLIQPLLLLLFVPAFYYQRYIKP